MKKGYAYHHGKLNTTSVFRAFKKYQFYYLGVNYVLHCHCRHCGTIVGCFFIKGRNKLIAIKNSIDNVQNTIDATLQERRDCLEKITKMCNKAKVRDENIWK